MSRRLVFALAVLTAVLVAAPAAALAARPVPVTHGLDYLHAQQRTDAGFGTPIATIWTIIGAVATGERMGATVWKQGTLTAVDYLQKQDLRRAAETGSGSNPPVFYARAILAYVAADRKDLLDRAGTPAVDLVARLEYYQSGTGSVSDPYSSFSPSISNPHTDDIVTTAWAILAMAASDAYSPADRLTSAAAWLAERGPNTDGGFPSQDQGGLSSDPTVTALAIQALVASGSTSTSGTVLSDAIAYLHGSSGRVQNTDGGFPGTSSKGTNGVATSTVIQAILAYGHEGPNSAHWSAVGIAGKDTPVTALKGLQPSPGNGAFRLRKGVQTNGIEVTGRALAALSNQSFDTYPAVRPPAVTPFKFRPIFLTIQPKAGASFTSTRDVLIKATYKDPIGGTGMNAAAIAVKVDKKTRTKSARIGQVSLSLQLKNVPNGSHTFDISIADRAGNVNSVERTFTVAHATPSPTPTPPPTSTPYVPPDNPYTPPPVITPTPPTDSPSPTTFPTTLPTSTPTGTSSGVPVVGPVVPSPSATPKGPKVGKSVDLATVLGGGLAVVLPLGALGFYYALHRREDLLATATEGQTLPGGGSTWQRVKGRLAGLKDIFKPAGR